MAGVIQITIRLNGNFKMLLVSKKSSVSELFAKVRKEVLGEKADDTNFYLICDGQQLEEGHTGSIDSVGIIHGSFLDFCQRVKGGSGKLKALPGKISLTLEPCCMTYDDDPLTCRAKMPCGCSISVEAMKHFCDAELSKGRCKFKCPSCSSDWPFFLIRHVLSVIVSSDQLTKLSMKVNDNFFGNLPKVQQCPSCRNYSERNELENNRVRCSICTIKNGKLYEFCWACLKPWKGDDIAMIAISSCGNAGCSGKDARLRYLEECPTKTIGQMNGVPTVRVCQSCGNLISHTDACKHMTCKCGFNFCFVCLKPQVNGEWQCGFHYSTCPVAPRQTSLP